MTQPSKGPFTALCASCDMLPATLVVIETERWICGLCAPLKRGTVRLLMTSEIAANCRSTPGDPA
jgi:hypothetical protein